MSQDIQAENVEEIKLEVPETETIETVEDIPVEDIPIEKNITENIEIKTKKPGRPKESRDVKPRPPRKKKVEVIEEDVELPRGLEGSLPIPIEPETDKAALMLELLRRQTQMRKNQKHQLWKSWFI